MFTSARRNMKWGEGMRGLGLGYTRGGQTFCMEGHIGRKKLQPRTVHFNYKL